MGTVKSFEFTFNFDENTQELSASNTASVTYSDCDGDLATEYKTKHPNTSDAISEYLVGEGGRFMPPELDLSQTDSWFRGLINANCNTAGKERMCIIRRICDSCSVESHRDIYYRRLTELPPMGANADAGEVYFIDTFMNNWFDNINGVKFNVLGVDFTLH